jgi:hypothetical protein
MSGERSIHLHGRLLAVSAASLSRWVAIVLLGFLTAAALVVVARRLAGALANPLEPAILFATGVLAATAAAAIRLGWFFTPTASAANSPPRRLDHAMMALTSLSVAALAAGLCVPETPALGTFLLCTLLGAEESWAWAWHIRHSISLPVPRPPSRAPTPRARLSLDPDVAVLSENVTQQLTRSQAADGDEELSGWLRTTFAPGQRTASVHVAFCPPFAATPQLEVEQLDGPEARIKTAQLLPYGARLDLKLAAAAEEPTNVLLQFSARTASGGTP